MAAEGTQMLLGVCKEIVGKDVDLTSWQNKIKEEMNLEYDDDESVEIGETVELKKQDTGYYAHERYKNGVLTIGCVGYPNVGKSSLMNALMGRKVVSVSRTPGHTKHFQTIFLTSNVRLCDCPGLVFPSLVPRHLQVLMGSFPIAQLRDPYSAIRYIAERLDLPRLLKIEHPEHDDEWSAMDICEGWAKKRGFVTAKAARLDAYRAANSLLRMALDGKICLCLRPIKYSQQKASWEQHPDVETVQWIQARSKDDASGTAAGSKAAATIRPGVDLLFSSDDEEQPRPAPATLAQAQRAYEPSSREDESSDASSDDADDSPVSFGGNKFSALNTTEGDGGDTT